MPAGEGPPEGDAVSDDSDPGDVRSAAGVSGDGESAGSVPEETATDDAQFGEEPGSADPDAGGLPGAAVGGTAETDSAGTETAVGPAADRRGRREVEVPQSLYRIVTVFSTLLSILLVVAGFTVLTMATTVFENPLASPVVRVLSLGVPTGTLVGHRTTLALGVGLTGLVFVAAGAGVYVYGSRFRAPGMGKSKDGSDEDSNDG